MQRIPSSYRRWALAAALLLAPTIDVAAAPAGDDTTPCLVDSVLVGDTVDFSRVGFHLRLLPSSFQLMRTYAHGRWPCAPDLTPTPGPLEVLTWWLSTDGLDSTVVGVAQGQPAGDPARDFLDVDPRGTATATFHSGSDDFWILVAGPKAGETLRDLFSLLAPEIDFRCFPRPGLGFPLTHLAVGAPVGSEPEAPSPLPGACPPGPVVASFVKSAQPRPRPDLDARIAEELLEMTKARSSPCAIDDLRTGDGLDLGRGGLHPRTPGPDHGLRALAVWADCTGRRPRRAVSVPTEWAALPPSELTLYLTQSQTLDQPVPNKIDPRDETVTFHTGGDDFRLALGPWEAPHFFEEREAILANLAPEIAPDCYYRPVSDGTWEDLVSLWIGDPRPALPTPPASTTLDLRFLREPATGCEGVLLPRQTDVLARAYFLEPDLWDGSFAVEGIPPGSHQEPGFGYLGSGRDARASWTNEAYAFEVALAGEVAFPDVAAIARAVDPEAQPECFLMTRLLTVDEVLARGFHVPTTPAGYTVSFVLQDTRADASCPSPRQPSTTLQWTFLDDFGRLIVVVVSRAQPLPATPPDLDANPIVWVDARGDAYWVSGQHPNGSEGPPQELLVDVARSLDPTLP